MAHTDDLKVTFIFHPLFLLVIGGSPPAVSAQVLAHPLLRVRSLMRAQGGPLKRLKTLVSGVRFYPYIYNKIIALRRS
jgi:hypothetical protein